MGNIWRVHKKIFCKVCRFRNMLYFCTAIDNQGRFAQLV